jgi:hypothetical protein
VAGVWDCAGDVLRFAPFEPLDVDEVRAGAEPLRDLLEFRSVEKGRIPGPLSDRGQNAFISPLRRSTGS